MTRERSDAAFYSTLLIILSLRDVENRSNVHALLNIYSVQGRNAGSESSDACMCSNKFDTPRQAAREKYYGNDRKRGARILSAVVSRANRRLRTCNDRFRSKRELSIADVGRRHCYCLRSSAGSALGSVFMKGPLRGRVMASGVFGYYDSGKADR